MITYKPITDYSKGIGQKNTGLGNQMFQVASTIGIAEKNNQWWTLPKWNHPFAHEFPCDDTEGFEIRRVAWGYRDMRVSGDVALRGYMQSEKYFLHCEDMIREMFTFKDSVYVEEGDFISVHVRRGDYNPEHLVWLDTDYYDRALSVLPDLPIYVFTDDIEAAQSLILADYYFTGAPFTDFQRMTKAKYHIIANSSFSWWAAWLSDAEAVVAPSQWFGIKKAKWETKDLIPEDWIIV